MRSLLHLCSFFVISFVFIGCAQGTININDIPKESLQPTTQIESFGDLQTHIGKIYDNEITNYKGKSGALLIQDGSQALIHRAALAKMAKKSILLQSSIYRDELSSKVLMRELWLAANRGVKVRLLIDDNGLDSDFSDIITLDSHPNIEVKIFNPYKNRSKFLRFPEMVYDFSRISRRMHNKIFVVDDVALIIGGRNVADEYFNSNTEINFTDTDVIFIGPVAQKAVENFNEYWAYERSIPAYLLPSKRSMKKYEENITQTISTLENPKEFEHYNRLVDEFVQDYNEKKFPILWGNATFIGDKPQKIEQNLESSPIYDVLKDMFAKTKNDVHIAMSYLVPGKQQSLELIDSLKNRGVQTYILTNSLASTDLLVVHSAWESYRKKFVKNGIKVYEYQYRGKKKRSGLRGKLKNTNASLHSKTIVFDERITWVGSFNLDPRSVSLNTESVVIFDNAQFSLALKQMIQSQMLEAWEVVEIDGKIHWRGYNNIGEYELHSSSPNASIFLRAVNMLAKILPEKLI